MNQAKDKTKIIAWIIIILLFFLLAFIQISIWKEHIQRIGQ